MSVVTAAEFKVLLQGNDTIQDIEVIEPVLIQSGDVVNSSINLRRCDIAKLTIRDHTNIAGIYMSMTRVGTLSLVNCAVDQLGIGGDPSSFDDIKLTNVSMSKLLITTVNLSNSLVIKRSSIDEIEIDESIIKTVSISTRANTGCDLSTRLTGHNEFKIAGSYERIMLSEARIYSMIFDKVRSEQIHIMQTNMGLFAGNIRFNTDLLNLNTVQIGLAYVTPY